MEADFITPLITLITVLSGSGGLFVTLRAWWDYRDGVGKREEEADEHFNKRLDERLQKTEAKLEAVQAQLDQEKEYTSCLVIALVRSGIEVPPR